VDDHDAGNPASFAVRSSATAEDLPDASFAGQQETFLNVHGIEEVLHKMKEVFASLYNDRAISYRVHKGLPTPTWRCRPVCSAWCVPTWAPPA
jgi:phosphoenolpyruvate synthase/pyruvate phosphate dikinase